VRLSETHLEENLSWKSSYNTPRTSDSLL
jgi:hypothetical protein